MSAMHDRNGHVLHIGDYVSCYGRVAIVVDGPSDGRIRVKSPNSKKGGFMALDEAIFEATAEEYADAVHDYSGCMLHVGDTVCVHGKYYVIERMEGQTLHLQPLKVEVPLNNALASDVVRVDA